MLNKVILMGRPTTTPEVKTTTSGKLVTSFTLAVNRLGKDAGADFLPVTCWEKTAEFVGKYVQKGKQFAVEGRLQQRTWTDNEGKKHNAIEVLASNVFFADSNSAPAAEKPAADSFMPESPEYVEITDDDDLPF